MDYKDKMNHILNNEKKYLETKISRLKIEYWSIIEQDPAEAERIKLEIEKLEKELGETHYNINVQNAGRHR